MLLVLKTYLDSRGEWTKKINPGMETPRKQTWHKRPLKFSWWSLFGEISVHASTFLCTAPGTHLVTARGGITGSGPCSAHLFWCSATLQNCLNQELPLCFYLLSCSCMDKAASPLNLQRSSADLHPHPELGCREGLPCPGASTGGNQWIWQSCPPPSLCRKNF